MKPTDKDERVLTLAPETVIQLKILLEPPKYKDFVFRVTVSGGGCSGFEYKITRVKYAPQDGDVIVDQEGVTVLIDYMSVPYIDGSTLQYDEFKGFGLKNPNATGSCGCGSSFSV